MGKASMCIQLLELLNTGRIYKINELADILETNPRNIIEYKKELEEAGYYINSIPGRYGGYQLDRNSIIPALKLLEEEKESLSEAYNYVLKKKDFINKNTLSLAFGKISTSIKLPTTEDNLMVIDKYQLQMDEANIRERYNFVDNAIRAKRVIKLEYNSLKNGLKTHILHPYKLFIYNNSWFFLAWNTEVGEVWYFKLNRIKKYEMLNEKFKILRGFKAEDYFTSSGFLNNGNFITVELIVKGVHKNLIQERVYGRNQKIEVIDDESVKATLDIQDEEQIISLILGWGTDVVLLKPTEIAKKIKQRAEEISCLYGGGQNEN